MKYRKTYVQLKAEITNDEAQRAKRYAKSRGMTFQGWLGQMIKRELRKEEAADGTSIG